METTVDAIKTLLKQPYWTVALVLGVVLILLASVIVPGWKVPPQRIELLTIIGIVLLVMSVGAFVFQHWSESTTKVASVSAGLDLSRVMEQDGIFSTMVSDCEIRVAVGRIEDYGRAEGVVVVLPCNEFFDDRCILDSNSALGSYVGRFYRGREVELLQVIRAECNLRFGCGTEEQKTADERAQSFGAGRCVLLKSPLGSPVPMALLSTTTQRAGQGLVARISYLFDGMQQLVTRLADLPRVHDVVMPVLGAGHGGINSSLAFVGLVLAVAEAARYGQGGQLLRKATIVVFQKDANKAGEVDETVIRRTLALVSWQKEIAIASGARRT